MAKFIPLPIVTPEMLETAQIMRFNDLKLGDFFLFGFELDNIYNRRINQKVGAKQFSYQEDSKHKPQLDEFWVRKVSNYQYVARIDVNGVDF